MEKTTHFETVATERKTRVRLVWPKPVGCAPRYSKPVGKEQMANYTLIVEREDANALGGGGYTMLAFASVTGLPLKIETEIVQRAADLLVKLLDYPVSRNCFSDSDTFAANITREWVTSGGEAIPYIGRPLR